MKTKYFSHATFWAREYRVPLFLLPHMVKKNSLALYKNAVAHFYHLNHKEDKAAAVGFRFFTNKENVTRYKKSAKGIQQDIQRMLDRSVRMDLRKLSDAELKKEFFVVVKMTEAYSDVYTKTEEIYLVKFESSPAAAAHRKLLRDLGALRFELRKAVEPLFHLLLGVFLKELVRRFGVKTADVFFYRREELPRLFEGKKISERMLQERKRGYAFIALRDKEMLLTGASFKKLFKEIVATTSDSDHLIGKTAMRGKATGRVNVLLHNKRSVAKEAARFADGEILVTEMTRPDTIFACKKAVAIITDEGGITSHAAILSREFKIPCVIGTKIATQVLKTGDLVEVDASKGVVRIIERARR